MTTTWKENAIQAKDKRDEAIARKRYEAAEETRLNEAEGIAQKWSIFTSCLTMLLGEDAAQDILAGEHKETRSTSLICLKSNGRTISCSNPYVWANDFKFMYSSNMNFNAEGKIINPSFFVSHHENEAWTDNYEYGERKNLRGIKITSAAQLGEVVQRMTDTYVRLAAAFPAWSAEQERIASEEKAEETLKEVGRAWGSVLDAVRDHVDNESYTRGRESEDRQRQDRVVNLSYADRHGIAMLREIVRKIEDGLELHPDEQAVWGLAVYTQSTDSSSDEFDY